MRIGFHYACRLRFIFTEYKKKRTEIELTPIFRTHLKKVGVSFL